MPMLSNLLHYRVTDAEHRVARLNDLVIDLPAANYPPVTYLVCSTLRFRFYPEHGSRPGHRPWLLSWKNVQSIDRHARMIRVDNLERGQAPEEDWLDKAVLLKRDILDALMLDLQKRTPVMANDLWLEEQDLPEGGLREGVDAFVLRAVDISFRAVVRRLTGGFLFSPKRLEQSNGLNRAQRDWKVIEFLRGDPRAALAGLTYHNLVTRLPYGEIAYLADLLPYLFSTELLTLLPDRTAADTLEIMIPTRQLQVFKEMNHEKALRLLALMRPDIVADLISRLKVMEARYWLEHMPREQSERVTDLLRYPADTAGGIMTNDFVTLPAVMRVEQANAKLVELLKLPGFINFIQFVYVFDAEDRQRLKGFLSLRDLLVSEGSKTLGDVMDPFLITLNPLEKASSAARRVIESGMTALPVIDPNGRLLGIITIDTALNLIVPSHETREILRLYP